MSRSSAEAATAHWGISAAASGRPSEKLPSAMTNPTQIAESILGPIRWDSPTHGFCRCPGEALHTQRTGPKHCLIHIDGAPTVYCFHSSCAATVAQANQKLRQALRSPQFAAPGPRPPLIYTPQGNGQPARDALSDWYAAALPTALADLAWPVADIERNSPVPGISKLAPRAQFHAWSQLWPSGSVIWTGDVMSSGAPGHANNFRPVERWRQLGPAGNFTCPSTFKPGSCSRSEQNIVERLFLVVESDTLTRD